MQISKVFHTQEFVGETNKEAYLKACSWYAQYVMSKKSKVEVKKVLFKAEMLDGRDSPTCKLELYTIFDDNDFNKGRCAACEQFHSLFYVNEQYNCQKCSQRGYRDDLDKKLGRIASWFKKQLDVTMHG